MSNDGTSRVRYFAKQFLRAEDFVDEQTYHVAMRRRHNIAHHAWGIASGLELQADDTGNPFVMPGLAVDGYGRELVLSAKQPLPLTEFEEKNTDTLDVWLEYDRLETEPAPRGYVDCGAEASSSPYRWQERPLVRMTVPDPAFPDRRRPQTVPEGDLDFDPERLPPDDPQQDWPVFLGRVERRRSSQTQPYSYDFDLADRPYIGLVGEEIAAPSGRVRVQIGAEKKDDQRRFAVFVLDGTNQVDPDDPEPSFAIDTNGNMTIGGDINVQGGVTIAGGALEFIVGEAVAEARPWSIYRSFKPSENTQQGSELHELRMELPDSGQEINQVAIGHWSENQNAFHSCLTIDDDCTVTVHGNLVVEGTLVEQQQSAAVLLSDEARNFLVAAQHSGIAGANVILPRFYDDSSYRSVTGSLHASVAAAQVDKSIASIVSMLKGDVFFDTLMDKVKKDSELQEKLSRALTPEE